MSDDKKPEEKPAEDKDKEGAKLIEKQGKNPIVKAAFKAKHGKGSQN